MTIYCPCCNQPMASGALLGPQGLFWQPDILPPKDDTDGRIPLHENKFLNRLLSGAKLTAQYCEPCDLLLAHPNLKKRQ